MKFHWFRFRE